MVKEEVGGGDVLVLEIERVGSLAKRQRQCCSMPTTTVRTVQNGGRFGKQVGHQTPQADQGKETHEKHGAGGPACATAGLGPESKTHDGIIFGGHDFFYKGAKSNIKVWPPVSISYVNY